MKVRTLPFIASILIILLMGVSTASATYSSNSNIFAFASSSSGCSADTDPSTSIQFNSTVTTTQSNHFQWSTQMNADTVNSSSLNPNKLDWMQFNMAIDSSGNIYGAIEYWTEHGMSQFSNHTKTIHNVNSQGHLNSGDIFQIEVSTNSTGAFYVDYTYYDSANSNYYSASIQISKVPGFAKGDIVPVYSWVLNIVAENSGSPSGGSVTFSSGGGTMEYFGGVSQGSSGSQPSCTPPLAENSDGLVPYTYEMSNMQYFTPTTSAGDVYQGFEY
jgi:hypothetical protein